MKRHPALIPLSHDHHHALVEARRLRRAADTPESAAVATAFLRFFAGETVEHYREEEELLFPLVVDFDETRELLVQALLEHQRLHALTGRLQQLVTTGGVIDDVMREAGELFEAHVRLEERRLFPMIERLLEDVPELQPVCVTSSRRPPLTKVAAHRWRPTSSTPLRSPGRPVPARRSTSTRSVTCS